MLTGGVGRRGGTHLKLRSALFLLVGLSSTACSDEGPDRSSPGVLGPDAATDAGGGLSGDGGVVVVPGNGRTQRVVSVAPNYVLTGDTYRYTPKTNSKTTALELGNAPTGMQMRGTMVEWNPTEQQAGSHRMTLRAVGREGTTEQELNVSVARATLRASGDIDPALGGRVVADSPAADKVRGASIDVSARAIGAATRLSISELDIAPPMPNAAGATRAVRFGPSGQVFATPARITLPLPEQVTMSRGRMGVYVHNREGRWERTPLLSVDPANGVATARALHFSIYAAIQSSLDLDVSLASAGAGSTCEGALVGRALLTSPLMDVELAAVNNLSEPLRLLVNKSDASLQDLLVAPGLSGSVRVVQVFDLVEGHGDTEVPRAQRLVATTLYFPGDGTATITHADALGNLLSKKTYAAPAAMLADIAQRMRGGATDVLFAGETGERLGLAARVHVLYFTGDASLDPVSVDDLGVAAVEVAPSFAAIATSTLGDRDCDGVVDDFDDVDDSLLPAIAATPSAVVRMFRGEDTTLEASVLRGAAGDATWSLLDAQDATLAEIAGAPNARRFSALASGRYLVSYRATSSGRALEHVFAIDVAERPEQNTAPRCQPSKDAETGRVGEALALTAVTSDDTLPASALRVEWGLVDTAAAEPTLRPVGTLSERGSRALFAPLASGNYELGCRAFDGQTYGPIGSVALSVVEATQNRAPADLVLTPASASLTVGAKLKLQASATDPDGDALSFDWQVDGATVDGQPEIDGDSSYLNITAFQEGTVKVTISVTDGKAAPLKASAEILVGPVVTGSVDADKDGWFAGTGPRADCNDSDAKVFPSATELCGGTVDLDCDGSVRGDDCDYDDVTTAQGDCDDQDANRSPLAVEICDAIDNDCDSLVDEDFSLGKVCIVGAGQCEVRGTFICSADGNAAICSETPQPSSPEVCGDKLDNDCDGVVDNTSLCSGSGGGDAGVPDAGGGTFDAGTPDAGCLAMGAEVCSDRIDNDCNGLVDAVDPACQTSASADSCQSVQLIEVGQTYGGSFELAQNDVTNSRCMPSMPDRVYGFQLATDSMVTVKVSGAKTFSWSLQEGSCSAAAVQMYELTCGSTEKANPMKGKTPLWLVLEGPSGDFQFTITATPLTTQR